MKKPTENIRRVKYKQNKHLEMLINDMEIQILSHGTKIIKQPIKKYLLPTYLLVYCFKGSAIACLGSDNTQVTCSEGTVTLYEPFTVVKSVTPVGKDHNYIYIYFNIFPLSSSSIFKRCAFPLESKPVHQKLSKMIANDFEFVANNDCQKDGFSHFLLQHFIRGFIANIMFEREEKHRKLAPFSTTETKLLDEVFAYTDVHLAEAVNITKLSLELGISYSSLNRTFQRYVKMTPGQFITRYKIGQGVIMLREGLSVKEAAKKLGFSSSFHFSKVFKQILKESPSDYMQGQ